MRFALGWLLLMTFATLDARADSFVERRSRNDASVEYDRLRGEWLRSLADRIGADPDPDIAWAGLAITTQAHGAVGDYTGALPPMPRTGAGRLMRYKFCSIKRCPEALSQWLAAEPDNLFVLLRARSDGAVDLARAARYDDYYLDTHALLAAVAARYDLTPPHKPEDYDSGLPVTIVDDEPISLVPLMIAYSLSLRALVQNRTLDRTVRARLAALLVAATGTPEAAVFGAHLGALAATDPVERERYCRLVLRASAADATIAQLSIENDGVPAAREFRKALRTRNGIDAVDAIVAHLPPQLRPAPVDAARMARCAAGDDRDVTTTTEISLDALDDDEPT
ncbi:hypothetical protein [Tahibacter soli]|uniref:Uncharacterized protein n=1 Tax=Tahibacter soli TaxID=2983605 RepID=A0A9X3YMH2_9GAMM|nr:hypothetical protein [Tahibacter soli]MDC8013458.1 hypothetical protein [Tahibacter soli]